MKHPQFKNLSISLSLCFVLLGTALIIHSCKKDNSAKSQSTITNAAVNRAKAWYESAYPVAAGGKHLTQGLVIADNGVYDYSQHIKPDWNHSAAYTRLNSNVIEIPIDPSVHLGSALKNQTANKEVYPKENSRSSFLLLNDGKNYTAYIMTIIADPSYLKNDPGKLARNTYSKRDTDFTGLVLYFTPKGNFVSGFAYKNGNLLTPAAQDSTSSGKTVQSIKGPNLKTNVATVYDCTFYYILTYEDGVLVSQVFIYADCTSEPTTGGGSPSNGTPGGGTSTPPPPPCPPSTGSGLGDESVPHLIINVTQPPGGGSGFPPPTTNPCTVTKPPVVTPSDPCTQLSQVNSLAQNAINVNLDHQIFNTLGTGNEYGTDENLASWPPNGTYMNSTLSSNYAESNLTANFTWNSTNGYTINIAHSHPNGGAPSPADVFKLYVNSNNTDLTNAGQTAVNYYMNNASITVVTSNATYVVTGANYSTLATLYAQYKANIDGFNTNYATIAGDHTGSTEYALLSIFGSSINLYKANANSSTFSVIAIDKNGNVTVTPCPIN